VAGGQAIFEEKCVVLPCLGEKCKNVNKKQQNV